MLREPTPITVKLCVRLPSSTKTPAEGRRTHRLKCCEYNSKDEDNSQKTLNDKNHEDSSQKFEQQEFDTFAYLEVVTLDISLCTFYPRKYMKIILILCNTSL